MRHNKKRSMRKKQQTIRMVQGLKSSVPKPYTKSSPKKAFIPGARK